MHLPSKIETFARPLPASVSAAIGSSEFRALSDDALKDDDNAAWILSLDSPVRRLWIERVWWIRWVDRLAENDFLHGDGWRFREFRQRWWVLCEENYVDPRDRWAGLLRSQQRRWFHPPRDRHAIAIWDAYLEAIETYHQRDLVFPSLDDVEAMFAALAGNFFQVFPFIEPHQREAVRHFGILDQFYNNLRDLQEDIEQGFCYFPEDRLAQFGLTRSQFLDFTAIGTPAYRQFMNFWLDEYLPQLIQNARPFLDAEDLHPSWQLLRYWSLHRYSRIEQVFYESHLDYRHFPARYWAEVRQDLAHWRWFPGRYGG